MAVLDSGQLDKLRQGLYRELRGAIDFDKPTANSALQAIEDWFNKVAVQSSLSTDIDAATSPVTLTANQKKKLAKYWMSTRWGRD